MAVNLHLEGVFYKSLGGEFFANVKGSEEVNMETIESLLRFPPITRPKETHILLSNFIRKKMYSLPFDEMYYIKLIPYSRIEAFISTQNSVSSKNTYDINFIEELYLKNIKTLNLERECSLCSANGVPDIEFIKKILSAFSVKYLKSAYAIPVIEEDKFIYIHGKGLNVSIDPLILIMYKVPILDFKMYIGEEALKIYTKVEIVRAVLKLGELSSIIERVALRYFDYNENLLNDLTKKSIYNAGN